MTVCVFAGPTLRPEDRTEASSVVWMPPAKQGDVYRVVSLLHPSVIGIVDGYFQWMPAVLHKEILWALQQGVHVFGAASMGALRAAELAPYGMRGVGRIFEAYRSGVMPPFDDPFEDDDEVAVVHGPAESGYLAASEALVNIRATLAAAERAGVIGAETRNLFAAIAKATFFPERSYERVLEQARLSAASATELEALQTWLPAGRVNQKRIDALSMLAALQAFVAADPARGRADFRFECTTLWERAIASLPAQSPHACEEVQVLDELRLDSARYLEWCRQLRQSPFETQQDVQAAGDESVYPPSGGLLDALAQAQAARRAQAQTPDAVIERHVLARLRETGEYDRLRVRAHDKRMRIAAMAGTPGIGQFSDLQLLGLEDWYFSRCLCDDMPDDIEAFASAAGYRDRRSFHEAIFAEYVYRQSVGGLDAAGGDGPKRSLK